MQTIKCAMYMITLISAPVDRSTLYTPADALGKLWSMCGRSQTLWERCERCVDARRLSGNAMNEVCTPTNAMGTL